MEMEILRSTEDESVNFVFKERTAPGYFEARYVRRESEYFACYLSSQSGCKQACRMCHLTATRQTSAAGATLEQYLEQARAVFDHYDRECPKAKLVHFNFMARGEAFDNPFFLNDGETLFQELGKESKKRNLVPRFLISTILPKSFAGSSLSALFPVIHPEIYYSIYSIHDEFRKKWLPKSMPVNDALEMLLEYQKNTRKIIKLHWAFIKGENDDVERDIAPLCWRIRDFQKRSDKDAGLRVDVAIVRYNPYDQRFGEESDEETIARNASAIKTLLPFSRVKIITRVGRDVKASCGMFVEPH